MSPSTTCLEVSQGIMPFCHACGSSRGLFDSDGDRLNYCGHCGGKIDWTHVVDADNDDELRPPQGDEIDPPDPIRAPVEEYERVGLALADELRRLSVKCYKLARDVANLEEDPLPGVGLRRVAAGIMADLAGWAKMEVPRHPHRLDSAHRVLEILARHPGTWHIRDNLLKDCNGNDVKIPVNLIIAAICTLHNTERDGRDLLDHAQHEMAALKRQIGRTGNVKG